MAQILVFRSNEPPAQYPLFRANTTIGSDEGCDIPVSGAQVRPLHAEIVSEGNLHHLMPLDRDAEVLVNGRKVKKASLEHYDVLRLGSVTMVYAPDSLELPRRSASEVSAMNQLETLYAFSRRLMDAGDLNKALALLLDETLTLSGASKGFIIFVENNVPTVKVARNVDRKELPPDEVLFSESIVLSALKDGQPLKRSRACWSRKGCFESSDDEGGNQEGDAGFICPFWTFRPLVARSPGAPGGSRMARRSPARGRGEGALQTPRGRFKAPHAPRAVSRRAH